MLLLLEEGYRWFSLGLAPLAGVGDRPGASLQERGVHQVYEHLTAVFSFKGLRSYKAKFEPVWEERFLVYQDGPPGLIRHGARARPHHAAMSRGPTSPKYRAGRETIGRNLGGWVAANWLISVLWL